MWGSVAHSTDVYLIETLIQPERISAIVKGIKKGEREVPMNNSVRSEILGGER